MILTEQDIAEISLSAVTVKDAIADVRAVEAAILAKLASAELPEPAGRVMAEHNGFVRGRLYRIEDRVDGKPLYTADQLTAWGNTRFAQGAAAQLAEKPSAWKWKVNRFHQHLEDYCPPADAYDEGTLIELYTRRQA